MREGIITSLSTGFQRNVAPETIMIGVSPFWPLEHTMMPQKDFELSWTIYNLTILFYKYKKKYIHEYKGGMMHFWHVNTFFDL